MSAFRIYGSCDIVDRLYQADGFRFKGASFAELPPLTSIRCKKRYTIPIFIECSRVISKGDTVIEIEHILNPLIFPAHAAAMEIERLRERVEQLESAR